MRACPRGRSSNREGTWNTGASRSGANQAARSPRRAERPQGAGNARANSKTKVKSGLKLSLARAQRENESVAVLISFGDQQRIDRVAAGGHSQPLVSAVLNPLHPNKED